MVLSLDFSMFDTTDTKLSRSADALESALAQLGKNAASVDDNNNNSGDFFVAPSATSGNGFDEWLAADLSFGALSSDESSLSSSPFSALEDSPVLGFDSFASAVGPSLFDLPMTFPSSCELPSSPVVEAKATLASAHVLTTTAVQQAAAALNIPWSAELESAVMAQAALGAAAAPLPMASPALVPKTEPEEVGFPSESSTPAVSRAASVAPETLLDAAAAASRAKASKKRQLTPEEEAEEIVAKRAKNTDAARRSRLKKLIKLEGLEAKASDLESANNALNMKIAILETEKNGFLAKDVEQTARIAQLEAQLAEAHAALTNRA
ncbi:hypothetical protein BG011_000306 [Mortierella polycephala]|uniref:BZIP domain-containing protein n=1 Tax=Mortierella polycephala TaxID=41804 RepID=A0A9P6Q9A2_9FUNG|nr:hypothetical protein BG011_000306 [Mortierella polycephala]